MYMWKCVHGKEIQVIWKFIEWKTCPLSLPFVICLFPSLFVVLTASCHFTWAFTCTVYLQHTGRRGDCTRERGAGTGQTCAGCARAVAFPRRTPSAGLLTQQPSVGPRIRAGRVLFGISCFRSSSAVFIQDLVLVLVQTLPRSPRVHFSTSCAHRTLSLGWSSFSPGNSMGKLTSDGGPCFSPQGS